MTTVTDVNTVTRWTEVTNIDSDRADGSSNDMGDISDRGARC